MELTVLSLHPLPGNAQQVHSELDAQITTINSHLVLDAVSVSIQHRVQMLAMTVGLAMSVLAMQRNLIQLI